MSGIAIEDSQTIDEDEAGAIRLGDIYIPPPYKPPDHIRKTLVMVKIVNKNFKSFYGEVTLGPFHERFTSIIGPNGSGKSNVIDALMFVFGSRANKIRSKKLSALIHESALHKNNDSCSVSIHYKQVIRDQEECQDVPNSEIIVSRTIFKDNSGFYKLNNEKVPYKTIFKLFKELGIDLNHNRFLILQGEVEQIALMRSMGRNENEVGMLEYMEDIIGTSRYKTALKNLQNKVEELIVSKSEKISNAEIARQQLEDCRKPRDNAVEFFQIENKIANYKNILLQKQLSISQSAFNKFEEKKRALNSTIAEQRKKIDVKKVEVLIQINGKSTKYSSEIAECEKKLKFLNIQYEKEAEALEQSKKKIGKVSTHLIEAKNSLQLKLKPEKNKLHEINDEYNKLIHKLKVSTNKSNQLQNNAKSKKSRLENAMMQLEERNLLITNLENIIQSSTNQIAKYQSELKDILQQEELNNKEVSENRNILNELKEIDFTRSRSKVLDFLHKKSNEGELDGLFGRLGDLGSIDVKYDIAISTACGALDNILVENITTAQKCIELLKQYNIGRATFIALDKQQHFWDNIKARFESPENLPRLFDLIRVNDTRILPAFYYVTRNTLVASNLDQATRVAYGRNRHRVVTVKGELIELAGTMSGGGNKFRRGIMSNQMLKKSQLYNTSKYNLNDIQRECERLEEIKRDITRRKDNAADQINALNQTLSRDRMKLNDIKKVIKPILEECQQLKEEIKNSETIEVPDEVSSLQIIVAEKKRVLDEQQDVVNKIEEELNEVLEKINSSVIGSIKFEQTKINNLKKEISKFQNQIMTLKVATTNNEKKVAMTKKQISSMELDIEKCQNQILKLQDEKKKIEENAQVVMREKEEHELSEVASVKRFTSEEWCIYLITGSKDLNTNFFNKEIFTYYLRNTNYSIY
ncbi:structural maintenance of chromosomes protein 4-like [Ctenocephalides felis]|uniref:structural maintenance of chromosomes protein 4-like n=1 Tax=Ctenocephalides felis TaxID=7515 RepID=UPI000E6E3F56|nr:structural maintenance of chromosomes protein 4-like [Ctenocephalides felis]